MKIAALRIDRSLRPGVDDCPAFSVQQDQAANVKADEATVIGIDPSLFEWPSGMAGLKPAVASKGRFSGLLVPGYGLGPLMGGTALMGEAIGNIGIDDRFSATDGESPAGSEDGHLAVRSGRIRLTGLAAQAQELDLGDKLDDPGAAGLDIMQVAIGGSAFARTLEKDGLVPAAATAVTGLAAQVISAAAHAVPSLRPLLPYAVGVSVGVRIYHTLLEEIGQPLRIDAILA